MVFSTEALGVLQVFSKPFSETAQISKSKTLYLFSASHCLTNVYYMPVVLISEEGIET